MILKKIEPINRILEKEHGLRIENIDFSQLRFIFEHYNDRRNIFIKTMGSLNAFENKEYQKSYLISEAARILLREIAPKRKKRRR